MICGILLYPPPANVASGSGEYANKGVGLVTCKLYSQERKKLSNRYFQFVGWIIGYLFGHNRYAKDVADIVPWQTSDLMAALIVNYCRANPNARLVAASNRLIEALNPNRLRNGSKRIQAKTGGKTVVIYDAIMRRAQQMLAERGFYTGSTDGKFGPRRERRSRSSRRIRKLRSPACPTSAPC